MLKQWPSDELQLATHPILSAQLPAARPANDAVERLRRLTIHLAAASLAAAVLLAIAGGIRFDNAGAGLFGEFFAALLLTSCLCWRTGALPRLADLLGAFGLVWLAGIVCGLISLMALHVHFPLVDRQLLAIDHGAGIDTAAVVRAIAKAPGWFMRAMLLSYEGTIPVILVSIVALSLLGDRVEAWRAAFCFVGTLLCVCLISILTPAKGIGVWLSPADFAALPGGSARYFWRSFDAYYVGADPVLRLDSLDGVVSFPSFHMVMGLIAVTMWRRRPWMAALIVAWAVPMLAATVPIGGHYVIDLVGGAALWLAWLGLSLRVAPAAPR